VFLISLAVEKKGFATLVFIVLLVAVFSLLGTRSRRSFNKTALG